MRLHGASGLPDGQNDGSGRSDRQIVHPHAFFVCLRDSRDHGGARDRERARSVDDDSCGSLDDLFSQIAGLRAVDRGVHPSSDTSWRFAELAGTNACGVVPSGDRGCGDGRLVAAADDSAGFQAAVLDGAAELQVAVAANRDVSCRAARMVVYPLCRHVDPRRFHHRLGRPLLPSQRNQRRRTVPPRAANITFRARSAGCR